MGVGHPRTRNECTIFGRVGSNKNVFNILFCVSLSLSLTFFLRRRAHMSILRTQDSENQKETHRIHFCLFDATYNTRCIKSFRFLPTGTSRSPVSPSFHMQLGTHTVCPKCFGFLTERICTVSSFWSAESTIALIESAPSQLEKMPEMVNIYQSKHKEDI